MRFIYFLMLFMGYAVSAQSLELKGVLDLTVPEAGNNGKALHLYVSADILDLSLYGIGVANNGGGTDGQEYTFPAISASAGDHILLPRSTAALTNYFGNLDLFDIVLEDAIASQNGDDAIELFFNGAVIETFGDIACQASATTLCPNYQFYEDAWAYKSNGVWIFGDAQCTDASTTSLTSNCPYPFLTEVTTPPTQPSTAAPTPTHAPEDVISIYGDTYTNIATNYNPNWGQSGFGQVNPTFNVGDGNEVLAYPNFNYQGTDLTTVNASAMEFLHVDIWTNADPTATIVKVSPINNGTGPAEILVTINHVAGQWYSADIPKSAFTGMTWNSVFQMKFAANGAGSTVPVDIYLDNIYFWKAPVELGAVATLSDLKVDGTTIPSFFSVDYDYSFAVPQGSMDVPQITATATDSNANTVITQATSVPGSATVVVTSQNGLVVNTYTVSFSFQVPTAPSTAAPTPTKAPENVISIYGDTYTNIATNYNPNWGQSGFGQVNPSFNVGDGNLVLAYPNFNYQGTELTTVNASDMEFLHVDIWTNADPSATIVQVSPINNGTGPAEILVTINHVAGQWYSADIPKSAFTGMTWNSVFQMKFAANGAGSTTPATIYLDNIYFWKAPVELGTVATLSDLKVDGSTIQNFAGVNFDYSFEVPQGSAAIPQITATATDSNANTVITQATDIPGDATVVVTSQNGLVVNTYTVSFSFELPTAPSTAAPTPMNAPEDVISIYGDTYTNIATNYNPNWGQSGFGQVNPTFNVGDGNLVLAYPNFNYQGTELTTVNASDMEFLHVDIWTNADPSATIVQVSPINNGTGAGEFLVTINHVAGQWYSADIPKSAFTGMTWDSVFQMKFAANGAGSTTPATIFLDNIYFWKAPVELGTVATLSDLQVDGSTIQNFEAVNFDYSFEVPQGSMDVPQIAATATDATANVEITQASMVPGSATVVVTSQNGLVVNTYTVAFSFELPTAPSTAAPTPTNAPEDVISIYGDTYTNIATNYNPNWGQSGFGQVNPTFNVGDGNEVLAYPNFNYQGTELTTVNASDMEFLHVDIWTNADPTATVVQVTPVNNGTGAPETLVTINHVAGQWFSVDIPKSAFTGMTWDSVFQMKFAANGPGSTVPVDIYLDNIYFWKAPVVMVPTTKLRNAFCNTTLSSFNANIYAENIAGATAYKFKVSDGMNEQEIVRPDSRFSMGFASGIMMGSTYNVSVAVEVDGNWGEYGEVCMVTTPLVLPTTKLRAIYCNTTIATMNDNIYADVIVGANMYKFRVANDVIDQEIERPDSRFSMAFATGVTAGTMYNVTVAVNINGVWSSYGAPCNITTPAALPTSQLRPAFCDGTVSAINSNFYAVFRAGAVGYKFKTIINGQEVEVERPDSRCFMSAFAGATMNQMYSIQVAVKFGDVWGDYGDACNLTVGMVAPPKLQLIDGAAFNIKAYPNPFVNQITLSLSNENMQSDIMVYDMTGKLIQQVSTEQTSLEIGNDWSKGIYLVQIVQGQETKNIRIVKQ